MIIKNSYLLSKDIKDAIETFGIKDYENQLRDIIIVPFVPHFILLCEFLEFSLVIYNGLGSFVDFFRYYPKSC